MLPVLRMFFLLFFKGFLPIIIITSYAIQAYAYIYTGIVKVTSLKQ